MRRKYVIATPCAPARRTSVVQIIHGPSACNYIVTGAAVIITSPVAAVIASLLATVLFSA